MTDTILLSAHSFIDIRSDYGHIGPFYWHNRLTASMVLLDSSENVVQEHHWDIWGSFAILFTLSDLHAWECR